MKKHFRYFSALIPMMIIVCQSFGQVSIERYVIAPLGHYDTGGTLSLSYTVGEPAVTTLLSINGTLILTQGFQQPEILPVGIDDPYELLVDYSIFPNPTTEVLNVKLSADIPVDLKLAVVDVRGRSTGLTIQEIRVVGEKTTIFNLGTLADGFYFLNVLTNSGELVQSFKVQKVH